MSYQVDAIGSARPLGDSYSRIKRSARPEEEFKSDFHDTHTSAHAPIAAISDAAHTVTDATRNAATSAVNAVANATNAAVDVAAGAADSAVDMASSAASSASNTLFGSSPSARTRARLDRDFFRAPASAAVPGIEDLIAGAGGILDDVELPAGARVLPLVHEHGGRLCEKAQQNVAVLRARRDAIARAQAGQAAEAEERVRLVQEAEGAYRRKLREAQQLVAEAERPAAAAQPDLAPIDAAIAEQQQVLRQLDSRPATEPLARARDEWLRARSALQQAESAALPGPDVESLAAARTRLQRELSARLAALDAEEDRLKVAVPTALNVDVDAARRSLAEQRRIAREDYDRDLALADRVRRETAESAARANADADRAAAETHAQMEARVARMRQLEDACAAARSEAERARLAVDAAATPAELVQARATLRQLIERRNGDADDSAARRRWEAEEALRMQDFSASELARQERHRLSEERRLGQHRLRGTRVGVSVSAPEEVVRLQPAVATREDTVMMPVRVQRVVPVDVPVADRHMLHVQSEAGQPPAGPFEPRALEPAEYRASEYHAPQRAPIPVPETLAEPAAPLPRCVDLEVERTVLQPREIAVTHRVLRPQLVAQVEQRDAVDTATARREYVLPVRLRGREAVAAHSEGSATVRDEVQVLRPGRPAETVSQQRATATVDREGRVHFEQQPQPAQQSGGGIFGGLKRLFGGGQAAVASTVGACPQAPDLSSVWALHPLL